MQLVPIEGSSAVKAAGFENGVLRVLWHSGHFKDYDGRTEADLSDLLASPSKGRFVRERLAGGGSPPAVTLPATPLDTFEPDECCGRRLSKAIAAGFLANDTAWTCSKCSVEWVAEAGVPPLGRHWRPKTWMAVFR